MCGRYSLVTSAKRIEAQFGKVTIKQALPDNYNVAPTQKAYVITDKAPDVVESFNWGLVPFWSKDGKNTGRLINARAEGIAAKPSFRIPIRKRRCLVFADSFYEWKRINGKKQPFRILLPNEELLVFAGIWEVWKQDKQVQTTFSIITTTPNKEMEDIHNRMPVILTTKETQKNWLTEEDLDVVLMLLQPAPDGTLQLYPSNPKVNSVKNNGADLHQRFEQPPSLFD
ncbi:MAG: SOS response-associated peptidase [Bacteroidota bacterium]